MLKAEHVRLANYSDLFTQQLIRLGLESLKDREIQRPTFMLRMPGVFTKGKFGLTYTSTDDGRSRTLIPQERRQRLLDTLWGLRSVPRGQESFHHYINRRFIGVQSRMIREFVGAKTGIQMIRNLSSHADKKKAVRGKIPFSHVSLDLADMVSFSDKTGRENLRFVFLLCDDFSGFLFANVLPLGKDGKGVSIVLRAILEKIRKLGGKPRIATSDLGLEFYNKNVQAIWKEFGVKHLKPITGTRIAPYVENRVRHFKRYVRLLSKLLFEDTEWFEPEIIRDATKAVNNIQRDSGFSAQEIVEKWRKHESMTPIIESYQKDDQERTVRVGVSNVEPGDFVRIRVATQKLGLSHKSHLGFRGDDLEIPVSWSVDTHRVIKKKNLRIRRTARYMLDNKLWYDRSQLLKIPKSTKVYTRMPRSIPEKIQLPGRRSSRLAGKKRISYKE